MYRVVGARTGVVYGYADTKRQLMRKLHKNYPWESDNKGVYPEPLKTEKDETE